MNDGVSSRGGRGGGRGGVCDWVEFLMFFWDVLACD